MTDENGYLTKKVKDYLKTKTKKLSGDETSVLEIFKEALPDLDLSQLSQRFQKIYEKAQATQEEEKQKRSARPKPSAAYNSGVCGKICSLSLKPFEPVNF